MTARIGRLFLRHPRLLGRLHRAMHRSAVDRACFVCLTVWAAVMDIRPGAQR